MQKSECIRSPRTRKHAGNTFTTARHHTRMRQILVHVERLVRINVLQHGVREQDPLQSGSRLTGNKRSALDYGINAPRDEQTFSMVGSEYLIRRTLSCTPSNTLSNDPCAFISDINELSSWHNTPGQSIRHAQITASTHQLFA